MFGRKNYGLDSPANDDNDEILFITISGINFDQSMSFG